MSQTSEPHDSALRELLSVSALIYNADTEFNINWALVGDQKYYNKYVELVNNDLNRSIIVYCISVDSYKDYYGIIYEKITSKEIVLSNCFAHQLMIDDKAVIGSKIVEDLPIIDSVEISDYDCDHRIFKTIDRCYVNENYIFSFEKKKFRIINGRGIYMFKYRYEVDYFFQEKRDMIINKTKIRVNKTNILNKIHQAARVNEESSKIINKMHQAARVNEDSISNTIKLVMSQYPQYEPEIIDNVSDIEYEHEQKLYINYQKLGIGGMKKQLKTLTKKVLMSRILSQNIIDSYCLKHTKGIILHGPPGTGKSLLARNIGKLLTRTITTFIKGPEMLDKWVGSSEKNIRKIFEPSVKAWKEKGVQSPLYILVIDELDSIGSSRTNNLMGTHNNSVLAQLLTMIDGLNNQQNLLLVGTTNRIDLIDQALLRPGRFEYQLEIDLPNKSERIDIINIYLDALRKTDMLDSDVDAQFIDQASDIFDGCSGAKIESLISSAKKKIINKMCVIDDDYLRCTYAINDNLPRISANVLQSVFKKLI